MDSDFGPRYSKPVAITHKGASSGIQVLSGERIAFTQSSFTSPNDVFIARGLDVFQEVLLGSDDASGTNVVVERITNLTEADLAAKELDKGEEFWFRGARNKRVQGWKFRPKGLEKGDKKKWPVVLIVHGGMLATFESRISRP